MWQFPRRGASVHECCCVQVVALKTACCSRPASKFNTWSKAVCKDEYLLDATRSQSGVQDGQIFWAGYEAGLDQATKEVVGAEKISAQSEGQSDFQDITKTYISELHTNCTDFTVAYDVDTYMGTASKCTSKSPDPCCANKTSRTFCPASEMDKLPRAPRGKEWGEGKIVFRNLFYNRTFGTEMFGPHDPTSARLCSNPAACSIDCKGKCQQLSAYLHRPDLANLGQAANGKIVCASSYSNQHGRTTPALDDPSRFVFPSIAPGYTQQKMLNFAPMTQMYFPPTIVAHSDDPHHQLRISCGNQTSRLTPVLSGYYIGDLIKAHTMYSNVSHSYCPPEGVFKNSGGEAMFGPQFEPQGGGGTIKIPSRGVIYDRNACFRNIFGDTAYCEAKFYLKIETCNTCDCPGREPNTTDLVKVATHFELTTNADGCKPW